MPLFKDLIGGGPCGLSARNSPKWTFEFRTAWGLGLGLGLDLGLGLYNSECCHLKDLRI